jgi:hypothetical protein
MPTTRPTPAVMPCELCGELVILDDPVNVCSCCYAVICKEHTARVTCPHRPIDHERGGGGGGSAPTDRRARGAGGEQDDG